MTAAGRCMREMRLAPARWDSVADTIDAEPEAADSLAHAINGADPDSACVMRRAVIALDMERLPDLIRIHFGE